MTEGDGIDLFMKRPILGTKMVKDKTHRLLDPLYRSVFLIYNVARRSGHSVGL